MKQPSRIRRSLLLAPLAALPIANARAVDAPRVVAMLSLIGDELSIVSRRMSTGSNVDRNEHHEIPIEDASLDGAALSAGDRAIAEAMPGAERLRVAIRDKRLYALQDDLLEPGKDSDAMRDSLQTLLAQAKATHLLLVTKRRDEATFPLANGKTTGSGKISGVGLYLDNSIRLKNVDTGQGGSGYFVCYAFVKVSLLEVAGLRVLGSRIGHGHRMTTALGSKDAVTAWDALPAEGKAAHLVQVIDQAVYGPAREIAAIR